MSPALSGRILTTGPPGKSLFFVVVALKYFNFIGVDLQIGFVSDVQQSGAIIHTFLFFKVFLKILLIYYS